MKNVLKLLFKCVLVLMPFWGICIFAAASPLSYLSSNSVSPYWNRVFTQKTQDKYYDVVIIGDSMAATSIMPEVLSDTTINLALSGSSPLEGYYSLEDYLGNNAAPTDVFMSYMDYHLEHSDFTFDACNQVHKFSIEEYKDIYSTIEQTGVVDFEDIDMDKYWSNAILSYIYFPSKYIASITNTIEEGGRLDKNTRRYEAITRHYGRSCIMTNNVYYNEGVKWHSFNVSPLQTNYLNRIIKLCEKNNIRLHILKLPLDIHSVYTEEYTEKITSYYEELLTGHDNVEFKWYPADYANEWFWDLYHMNQHGSFRFSMQLKSEYPEIFGDYSATADQMLALNDDLEIENEVAELFEWIDQKNYTVVLHNGIVDKEEFDGVYNATMKCNNQQLTASNDESIFFVSADGSDVTDITINRQTDGIHVRANGEEYLWQSACDGKLGILIIDNSNNILVLERSVSFDSNTYTYEKMESN